MNDACSFFYTAVLASFAVLALATVATAVVLLTNWALGFPRDKNGSS